MGAVKAGLELLQKGLPSLPPGSKLHQTVLKAVGDIGKEMMDTQADTASVIQQLMAAAKSQQQAGPPGPGMGGGGMPPPPPMGHPPPMPMAA